jgi:Putative DNA-binding domain
MNGREAQRQQDLVQALLAGREAPGLAGLAGVGSTRGLQAYRCNAQALSARALGAVFPRLQAWLGETEFAAMAWAFWRAQPPERGDLACWGQALPEFLQAQPGMEALPPDCARLEWAAHRAERAPDAELDWASLQALAEHDPERLRLRLRPGLTLLSLAPEAAALWPVQAVTRPVLLLVWRREWRAEACVLDADTYAFMRALLDGDDLQRCLERAGEFDFSAWLRAALSQAWLAGIAVIEEGTRS